MALADMARFDGKNPVSLRDISLRQSISLLYLEQIFLRLKKNNIVKSVRGTNGGYIISKNINDLKISDIFYALDEKVKTVGCKNCLLYTSPSPRDRSSSRMPSSA